MICKSFRCCLVHGPCMCDCFRKSSPHQPYILYLRMMNHDCAMMYYDGKAGVTCAKLSVVLQQEPVMVR
jgi:hypothetical protein